MPALVAGIPIQETQSDIKRDRRVKPGDDSNRRDKMPEIIVHLAEGRAADAKKALMKDITEAVVKNLGAKPETVTVSIIETPRALKMKGGVLFSER
jgi:4-oxalocrotonate tautomerase